MKLVGQDKPDLDVVAHYGVKGMRWGFRKRYAEKITRTTDSLDRVASGKGSVLDKAKTTARVSAVQVVKGRGFKGAAALQSKKLKEHRDRVVKGEKKVKDILMMYGRVNNFDLISAGRDKYRKG